MEENNHNILIRSIRNRVYATIAIIFAILSLALLVSWYKSKPLRVRNKIMNRFLIGVGFFLLFGGFISIFDMKQKNNSDTRRDNKERSVYNGKTESEYTDDYRNTSKYQCQIKMANVKSLYGNNVSNSDDPHHEEYIQAEEDCQTALSGRNVEHAQKSPERQRKEDVLIYFFALLAYVVGAGLYSDYRRNKMIKIEKEEEAKANSSSI